MRSKPRPIESRSAGSGGTAAARPARASQAARSGCERLTSREPHRLIMPGGIRPPVESHEPARISSRPATALSAIASSSSRIPSPTATTGLTNVITVARPGPTAWISAKKSRKPAALQTSPSTTTDSDRLAARHRCRRRERGERREHERRDAHRRGYRTERVDLAEAVLDDHRADRVADRGEQDREPAEQLARAAGDVEPEQHDHAGEADDQADQPRALGALLVVEPDRHQRDDQRHGGDQDRGEAGADALLAEADQRPRQADLDHGVDEQDPPVPADPAQRALVPGVGQQHGERDDDAAERDPDRRHVLDRELDEQVGDAPDDRDGGEQPPRARCHGGRSHRPHDSSRAAAAPVGSLAAASSRADTTSRAAGAVRNPGNRSCSAAAPVRRGPPARRARATRSARCGRCSA